MTIIDKIGNYIIEDIDGWAGEERFERMWKEHFCFIPPLDTMPLEIRDKLKFFARKIYLESIDIEDSIQTLANQAYDDGIKDGRDSQLHKLTNASETFMKEVLHDLKHNMEHHQQNFLNSINS